MADEPEWLMMQRVDEGRRTNFAAASLALAPLAPVLMLPACFAAEQNLLHTPITSILYAILGFSFWWVGDKKAGAGSTLRYLMRFSAIVCAIMLVITCLLAFA